MGSKGEIGTGCLDENSAVRFVQGRLPEAEVGSIDEQVDQCEGCRLLLDEAVWAVRGQSTSPTPAAPPAVTHPDGGISFITMELVPGTSLGHRLRAGGRMSARAALRLTPHLKNARGGDSATGMKRSAGRHSAARETLGSEREPAFDGKARRAAIPPMRGDASAAVSERSRRARSTDPEEGFIL